MGVENETKNVSDPDCSRSPLGPAVGHLARTPDFLTPK